MEHGKEESKCESLSGHSLHSLRQSPEPRVTTPRRAAEALHHQPKLSFLSTCYSDPAQLDSRLISNLFLPVLIGNPVDPGLSMGMWPTGRACCSWVTPVIFSVIWACDISSSFSLLLCAVALTPEHLLTESHLQITL